MIKIDLSRLGTDRLGFRGLDMDAEGTAWGSTLESMAADLWDRRGSGMLGWISLPDDRSAVGSISGFAAEAAGRFTDVVVLGIGGSSLGAMAVISALQHPLRFMQADGDGMRVHFVDNVDPDQLTALLQVLEPVRTLVNVISKSGSTTETMAAYLVLRKWLADAGVDVSGHVVVTTDPESGSLRPLAEAEGYRAFDVPPSVGGRFSVFSPVGLLPIALAGVDIGALLDGAADVNARVRDPYGDNAMLQSSLVQYLSWQAGRDISVLMPYSSRLRNVAAWFVQLWAESLGKAVDLRGSRVNAGSTPLAALGATDQHSQVQLFNEGPDNKIVCFVRVSTFDSTVTIPAAPEAAPGLAYLEGQTFNRLINAEQSATAHALMRHGKPGYALEVEDVSARSLGQLLQFLMWQTAIMGELTGVDTYDQPGVELGKAYTYALMGRSDHADLRAELAAEGVSEAAED